ISSRNLYQYVKLTLSSQTEYGAASRFASSWNPTSSPLLESDQGGIVMLISTALVIQSHRFEDDLTGRITLEFPYQMSPGRRMRLWTIGAGRRPSPFGGIPDVPGVIAKRIQVALRCKVVPQTTHTLIYVELQRLRGRGVLDIEVQVVYKMSCSLVCSEVLPPKSTTKGNSTSFKRKLGG